MKRAMLIGGLLATLCLTAHGQADKAVERAVRASSLVVEAEIARFERPSSNALIKIVEDLKGASTAEKIRVNLDKAPAGMWPKLGERTILCLLQDESGKYELAAHYAAVLPTEDDVRFIVRKVGTPAVPVEKPDTTGGAGTGPVTPPKPKSLLETRASMSETVLMGTLSNVQPQEGGAVGTFAVEKSLQGFGNYPAPVTVQFPPAAKLPEAGRYVLFLRARPVDGGFGVVNAQWGIVSIEDDAGQQKIDQEFSDLGIKPGKLTSIQATIIEWQSAWNARNIERCMKCYSASNPLRKQYEASADAKAKLKAQLSEFPGKVDMTIQRIQVSRASIEGAQAAADVTVLLTISAAGGSQDRRTATMKFVNQGGEWLILEEGF